MDLDALETVDDEVREDVPVPVVFETGRAGTGKTYRLVQEAGAKDSSIHLCATTGIAAVNLGSVTLNSTLRYFDTASLRENFLTGQLTRVLKDLALHRRWLAIDEGSMLEADQLDLVYRGVEEANRYREVQGRPLGIRLVGDFAQLPPVQGRWAFEADCWPRFAERTTRLEKVWRQDGGAFLDALNAAREGRGGDAADILENAGATWCAAREEEFDGTTILPKNQLVSRHNALALARHPGKVIEVGSRRWGKQRSEWGENQRTHEWGIPPRAEFKLGAYVMILSNDTEAFAWANGDCGHIVDYGGTAPFDHFDVELVRTRKVERIERIRRRVDVKARPDDWDDEENRGRGWGKRYKDSERRAYVLGEVEFFPLRLAYSSTVHKSQGLSLDRVQCDMRDRFFGAPAMGYVALSRCRTLEGLRLVCPKDVFVSRINMDPRVRGYV